MSCAPDASDQGSTRRPRDGLLREGVWSDSDAAAEPLTTEKYPVVAELGRGGMGMVYRDEARVAEADLAAPLGGADVLRW